MRIHSAINQGKPAVTRLASPNPQTKPIRLMMRNNTISEMNQVRNTRQNSFMRHPMRNCGTRQGRVCPWADCVFFPTGQRYCVPPEARGSAPPTRSVFVAPVCSTRSMISWTRSMAIPFLCSTATRPPKCGITLPHSCGRACHCQPWRSSGHNSRYNTIRRTSGNIAPTLGSSANPDSRNA